MNEQEKDGAILMLARAYIRLAKRDQRDSMGEVAMKRLVELWPEAFKTGATLADWMGLPQATYTILYDGQAMRCHFCGKVTYHPEDVKQKYCAYCHLFLDDLNWEEWEPPEPLRIEKD